MSIRPSTRTACVLVKMARDPTLPAGLDPAGHPSPEESFAVLEPAAVAGLTLARDIVGPEGSVLAVSLGGPKVEEALRRALEQEADAALRLHSARWRHLTAPTVAEALAHAIRSWGPVPDVILCGDRSIDDGAGLVGPTVARRLGLPWVTGVASAEVFEDRTLLVRRRRDRGERLLVQVSLPAVLCLEPTTLVLEPASTSAILRAAGAPVALAAAHMLGPESLPPLESLRPAVLPASTPDSALAPSRRIWSMFWGAEQRRDGAVHEVPVAEAARRIVDLLEERGLFR